MKILYICNFKNVHARAFVEYFAHAPGYEVTVISTFPAAPMDGVRLVAPGGQVRPRQIGLRGRLAERVYAFFAAAPDLLVRVRNLEMFYQVWKAGRLIRRALDDLGDDFDVVHAFRTQPEGLAAVAAKRRIGAAPLFLSTWGQDFVLFAERSPLMKRRVRSAMRHVDVLLADNPRDERIARETFGLPPSAVSRVYPANGGLDLELLRRAEDTPAPILEGSPTLLSMRGYENAYIRVRVLLEAFRLFLATHPDARLYVDVNAVRRDPARDELLRSWIDDLDLTRHVTVMHLDRDGVFAHMRATDLHVSATISDGLPMSLLEALYFGQITVTVDHESTRAPIQAASGAFTYSTLDPAIIAGTWETALREAPPRTVRRDANRALLEQHFSRSAVMHRIQELYRTTAHPRN